MFSWFSSSFTILFLYSFSFAESFISPTLKCWQASGLGPQALTLPTLPPLVSPSNICTLKTDKFISPARTIYTEPQTHISN